jgi:tetratricopeptide (TPR) repeat protein
LEVALGQMRVWRAFTDLRLGQAVQIRQAVRASLPVLRAAPDSAPLAEALWIDAIVSWLSGDFASAAESAQAGLALNRKRGRPWQVAILTGVLGGVRHEQGAYAEAYALLTDGLRQCQALGVPHLTAFTLGTLARTAQALGRREDLQHLLQEQLRLAAETNDRSVLAYVLVNLALAHQADGELAAARERFEQAADQYQTIGDQWSVARTHLYRGQLELDAGLPDEAQAHFVRALQMTRDAQLEPYALDCLEGMARVKTLQGAPGMALALATHVIDHPATAQGTRDRAERLCAELQSHLTAQQVEAARARARGAGWKALAADFLAPADRV